MPVYSDLVKKPFFKIEYTKEMIKEIQKCSKDFFYFCKYIKIINPDLGLMVFTPRWYQKEILNNIANNRYFVGLCARQTGKTTCVCAYIIWYSIFHSNKYIGCVSNKEDSAKYILKRIKHMYEELPAFLKPGVNFYNKKSISFDNGTEIVISATSPDAFRSKTLNLLFCDEIAFVPRTITEEFWSANYPTLSASKTSKIIMISTPNGIGNLFHKIYRGAELNENGFVCNKFDYNVIEGRDGKWRKEQEKILGKVVFAQEHSCEFIGSMRSVISAEILEDLLTKTVEPNFYELNDKFRIYERPVSGANYIIGVDIGKGTGQHDSVIQIFKVNSIDPFKIEQVAVYQNNLIDVYSFSDIIYKLAIFYNNAFILVENNAEGNTVVSKLWWDYEYENLINESSKKTGLGVRATKTTKPKAVLLMKKIIEEDFIIIYDEETIRQLLTFVEVSENIFKGKDGLPDDLISALYWVIYISTFDIYDDEITLSNNTDDEGWGFILENDQINFTRNEF